MNLTNTKDWLEEHRLKEKELVKDKRVKSLRVIDMLISDTMSEDKLLSTIYRIAHSASGICGNEHESWQKETQKLYRKLMKVT